MSSCIVTAHVTELTTKCAQTQYALRVLRGHGLNDKAMHSVYFRSVVVARPLYAVSAWHVLARASDRRPIDALFHRARRQGYCPPDLPSFEELCDSTDDELFRKAVMPRSHTHRTLYALSQYLVGLGPVTPSPTSSATCRQASSFLTSSCTIWMSSHTKFCDFFVTVSDSLNGC